MVTNCRKRIKNPFLLQSVATSTKTALLAIQLKTTSYTFPLDILFTSALIVYDLKRSALVHHHAADSFNLSSGNSAVLCFVNSLSSL